MSAAPNNARHAPGDHIVPDQPPASRRVTLDAPWAWLELGWRDLWRAPHISLAYGIIVAGAALLIALGLSRHGELSLFLPLTGGFLLIGPIIAAGLYDTSRRLSRGEVPTLRTAIGAPFEAAGQLPFLGVVLLLIYFAWLQIAFLLLLLFLGTQAPPAIGDLMRTLLMTPRGLGLLIVGSVVGGVLAALVFTISVFSAPMLHDRRVDAVSAAQASARAVLQNAGPMMLWAVLIVGITTAGLATLLVGLIIAFPLCAHATWHAYAEVFGTHADENRS